MIGDMIFPPTRPRENIPERGLCVGEDCDRHFISWRVVMFPDRDELQMHIPTPKFGWRVVASRPAQQKEKVA